MRNASGDGDDGADTLGIGGTGTSEAPVDGGETGTPAFVGVEPEAAGSELLTPAVAAEPAEF